MKAYLSVASFTDAWIETPLQAYSEGKSLVASFTDAWIETPRFVCLPLTLESHLLQMRGLKHFDCTAQLPISRSHLLQMRGLKLNGVQQLGK